MRIWQTSITDRIERAIRERPNGDALSTAAGTLSYREFGGLVDEFTNRLRSRTEPGEFVGIDARRGTTAIIAMVGALRARRPFAFIDDRDSVSSNREKVSLLHVKHLAGADSDGSATLGTVPDEWRPVGGTDAPGVLTAVEDEIGYAIYTSGSTGTPKCVLVRSAPLQSVIGDHVERLEVTAESRTLQFARLTFDGCITEILWTLTGGGCLVVLDETDLAPGPVLQKTLESYGITHLKTTPFALTATEPSPAMSLRRVINGGGACRPAVVGKWAAVATFHNAYGLTETTVCNLLSRPLTAADCQHGVPLGDLVGDCSYYLRAVDDPAWDWSDEMVDRGELVITGAVVAAGYLDQDGLRPLAEDGFASAYRTGDVVERRDGQLYFVERLDRQVKVRGYRLDPGEIENAVCQVASVLDAVVVAESHDGSPDAAPDALVCYYQGSRDPRSVRQELAGRLDPYKIPSVFEQVESFPYTPNGKVDRNALRARRRSTESRAAGASPGSQVLQLVRALTGVDDIGLEDNFFDVGGDSASAVALVNRIKELGWVDVGVRDVLRAENLGMIAEQLQDRVG